MLEPIYEYVKGHGWAPTPAQRIIAQATRKHDGKLYRVTFLEGPAKPGDRLAYHNRDDYTVDRIRWWAEWEDRGKIIPAGFGPCTNAGRIDAYVVITEAL